MTTATAVVTDLSKTLPKGWRFRDTPGHGYLIPSPEANANVPDFLRQHEYEEDCAYHITVVFNPLLFSHEILVSSIQSMKDWFPNEYEQAFNTILERGESRLKDDYFYTTNDNVGKYHPNCAWGDWYEGLPEGMVLVCAGRVQAATKPEIGRCREDEKYFLIPKAEYEAGKMFFDETRYPQAYFIKKP